MCDRFQEVLNFYCFTSLLCLTPTLYGGKGDKWEYLLQCAIVFMNFYCFTALLCLTLTLYGGKWKYLLQSGIVFINFIKSDTNSVWTMESLEGSEGQLYPYPGKVKSYVWAHFGFHKSMKDGKLDLTTAMCRECKKECTNNGKGLHMNFQDKYKNNRVMYSFFFFFFFVDCICGPVINTAKIYVLAYLV